MGLCNTDKHNALELIRAQCEIIHNCIEVEMIDDLEIASLLNVQADIINKIVDFKNTRALNKARMAKKLSKKILKRNQNDKE